MVWLKLGVFPDMTVEQARKSALAALTVFADNNNPAEIKRAAKQEPTFAEVFTLFLSGKRKRNGQPLGERTKRDYQDSVRLHLSKLQNLKLSEIERDEVKRVHAEITKLSPASANRAIALISSLYNYAIDELGVFGGINPAARVKKNFEAPRERFAQADELPRLFAAMANDPMGDFFLMALLTGARRANVQAMRKSEINLDEGVWRIPMTKNGTSQNVTLSPEAVSVLSGRMATLESDFIFPGTGKTGHLVEPKTAWARILKNAGLENLRIHDLRRTLGSWQAKSGASLTIIGKSLNHKTHQATAIYARLDLDPVRQSVNTATAAMMEAGGLKPGAQIVPIAKHA
jgi:integrase